MCPPARKPETIHTHVSDDEVCYATPSRNLDPYASEYEGYMGNYGNTMDRWYRRAAVVVWLRERAFAVRAEMSPHWALGALKERIGAGSASEAREMARSLLTSWGGVATREERRGFFGRAMAVAKGLDDAGLAAGLLEPFRVEALTRADAPAFVALLERYGEEWMRVLLSTWSARDRL